MGKKSIPDPPPRPEKKKKQTTLIGDKVRAGVMLSTKLREIAQEDTELISGPDGECLGTKAEALARLMWKMALGYKETDIKAGVAVEKIIAPDRGMIQLIWDRMEGRAAPVNDSLRKKRKLPKKVSDANKTRLNDMIPGKNAD